MSDALARLKEYESWYRTNFSETIEVLFPDRVAAVVESFDEEDKFRVTLLTKSSLEIITCYLAVEGRHRASMQMESYPLNSLKKFTEEIPGTRSVRLVSDSPRKFAIYGETNEPIVTIDTTQEYTGWVETSRELHSLIIELRKHL